MSASKAGGIAGFVIHLLLGALLIMGGAFKLSGQLPPEAVEQNKQRGLSEELTMIAVGEIVIAILLVLPWTSSLGTLLVSAFFGGTICFHMQYNEPYIFQSVLLILTWVGAALRYPNLFDSFLSKPPASPKTG